MGDPNIIEILQSIVKCLGKDKVEQLQDNLVFVQRTKGGEDGSISRSLMVIDDVQLPISIIKSSTFVPIYEALNSIERKIPTRILRYCKEQFFELVNSEVPNKKLCLVDYDTIENESDIEFVVGVGVVNQHLSKIGYKSVKTVDLFKDLVFNTALYNPQEIIENTLPELQGTLPIYKYLNQLGFKSQEDFNNSRYKETGLKTLTDFQSSTYRKAYLKNAFNLPVSDILQNFPDKAFVFIPYATIRDGDVDLIKEFLILKFDEVLCNGTFQKTYYRKLACFYDYLKFGW